MDNERFSGGQAHSAKEELNLFSNYSIKHRKTQELCGIIVNKGVIYTDELTLISFLSEDEINENFKNVDFFAGIMEGLQDALAHKKSANMDNTM